MMLKRFLASLFAVALLTLSPRDGEFVTHTFSVVAYDAEAQEFGVAVTTFPMAVGRLCPFSKAEVGAIATQATVNPGFGPRGLELLEKGKTAQEAIDELLKDDKAREQRQLAIIDRKMNIAVHTGKECIDFAGHIVGKYYSVQGNMLKNRETLEAMDRVMRRLCEDNGNRIPLAVRLMRAIEAGHNAGGDKRGLRSAAILVTRKDVNDWKGWDRYVDFRVDNDEDPVGELKDILGKNFTWKRKKYAFECGAAKAEITPAKPESCYLAGFGMDRTAKEVHDPLWARAAAFRLGEQRVILIECDLIGLLNLRVRSMKKKIEAATKVPAANITIACTHNHSGPDTLGLWGPMPGVTGLDKAYIEFLEDRVVQAAKQAFGNLKPATAAFGEVTIEGLTKDVRDPVVMNERASGAVFRAEGAAVCVLANWAAHPEAAGSKNTSITSDYPHYLREKLESEFRGAVAIHISADIGGMQTPKTDGHGWDELKRVGETIGEKLAEALRKASEDKVERMRVTQTDLELPIENAMFKNAMLAKVFGEPEGIRKDGDHVYLATELTAFRIQDAVFVSVPGEMFPELGKEVFAAIDAPHKFLIGLGNDELGYIVPKDQWTKTGYEESMSLGRETAPLLLKALTRLLKDF